MQTTRPLHPTLKRCIILAYLVLFILGICLDNPEAPIVIDLRKAPSCAFAAPIPAAHFHDRQQFLAKALHHLNASAFITEPGPTAQYYFNVSTTNWKLSERPFLFVLSPEVLNDGSDVAPRITVLAPKFEITRASLLDVPLSPDAQLSLTTWAEDASPYKVAHDSLGPLAQGNAVYVDGATRWFVVSGLQDAFGKNTTVSFPPAEISDLRSQKSQAEIQIMKCANELTVEAIRATRKKMFMGMTEREASTKIAALLASAGLQNGGCLTLFGENAALPHGSGSNRSLNPTDFALFDCTATLYGYWADVTRTIALKDSRIPPDHLQIWEDVRRAQIMALDVVKNGTTTGEVDAAARRFLRAVGYGEEFTHRLGHGIGLEMHERPYLVPGSSDVLRPGHTFSDEPGVYIEGKVGVRSEDCFYVNEDGRPELLTEGTGGLAADPWNP